MTPHSSSRLGLLLSLALLLGACSSMSGLDGSSSYGCKAPDGVLCDSVAGNYYNAMQGNLPSQRNGAAARAATGAPPNDATPTPARPVVATQLSALTSNLVPVSNMQAPPAAYTAMPLRSAARVLRLWVKPWEDADGDLMDQTYVYVPIDTGRWLIDHAQRQIRDAYAPTRAPRAANAASGDGTTRAESTPAVGSPSALDVAQRLPPARTIVPKNAPTSGAGNVK
jgi:conjugal transfer pilus assembly protein TraV